MDHVITPTLNWYREVLQCFQLFEAISISRSCFQLVFKIGAVSNFPKIYHRNIDSPNALYRQSQSTVETHFIKRKIDVYIDL